MISANFFNKTKIGSKNINFFSCSKSQNFSQMNIVVKFIHKKKMSSKKISLEYNDAQQNVHQTINRVDALIQV